MTIHIHPHIEKTLFSQFSKIGKQREIEDNKNLRDLTKKGIKIPRELSMRTRPTN